VRKEAIKLLLFGDSVLVRVANILLQPLVHFALWQNWTPEVQPGIVINAAEELALARLCDSRKATLQHGFS
jgi:hypothetical protein